LEGIQLQGRRAAAKQKEKVELGRGLYKQVTPGGVSDGLPGNASTTAPDYWMPNTLNRYLPSQRTVLALSPGLC